MSQLKLSEEEKNSIARQAIEKIFGHMDYSAWQKVVDGEIMPPLPLPKYAKQWSLFK